MEEELQRRLNKRNKKKAAAEATGLAASAVKQDSGIPQPAAENLEKHQMQGMVAASADSVEVGVSDDTAGVATTDSKSTTESTASSPPLTFQSAAGTAIDDTQAEPAHRPQPEFIWPTPSTCSCSASLLPAQPRALEARPPCECAATLNFLLCVAARGMAVLGWGQDSGLERAAEAEVAG
jgi:hypothetical protein